MDDDEDDEQDDDLFLQPTANGGPRNGLVRRSWANSSDKVWILPIFIIIIKKRISYHDIQMIRIVKHVINEICRTTQVKPKSFGFTVKTATLG